MITRTETLTVTVAGSGGTVQTGRPLHGELLAVHLDYGGTIATTDVTVATVGPPALTLLDITDNASDGWYYPRAELVSTAGSALANVADRLPLTGFVQAVVGGAEDGDTVAVTVVYAWL